MGYGLIHVKGKKMELIQMGVLRLAKLGSHELKLKRIFERTLQLVDEYKPKKHSISYDSLEKNKSNKVWVCWLEISHVKEGSYFIDNQEE